MAISLPFGSGNTGPNDWSDVYGNDAQLVAEVDDRDGNYQTIFSQIAFSGNDTASGTYGLHGANVAPIASGGATSNWVGVPTFYFDDADYATSSKTQKLRLRAQVNTNATAWSSVTATFGLYPITWAGGADSFTCTLGTVVAGSTVAIANPSASSTNQGNSGDFTIPSDGQYSFGLVLSAAITNNAIAQFALQLQTRWV